MDRGVSLLLSFWTTNTNSSLCPETFLLQNISDDRLSGRFSTVDARGNPLRGVLLNFDMQDMVKVKRPSVLRKRTNAAAVGSSAGFEPIEKKMSNEEKSNGELACPCPCHCSFSDSVSQQDHGKDSSSDVVGSKEITIPPETDTQAVEEEDKPCERFPFLIKHILLFISQMFPLQTYMSTNEEGTMLVIQHSWYEVGHVVRSLTGLPKTKITMKFFCSSIFPMWQRSYHLM